MVFSATKLTAILILFPFIGFCSCYDPNFTITEVLNHDAQNLHIFSCRILKTYLRNWNFESIAVVTARYKGAPVDIVYLNTGGGSTAGGTKLLPNEAWLIFSSTKDSLHYGATVCHNLSVVLSDGKERGCDRNSMHLGEIYLDLLLQYQKIQESRYTGGREFYSGNYLIAKGQFKNGKAHGEWHHFSNRAGYQGQKLRSTINYREGQLHGMYVTYYEQAEQQVIEERSKYDAGLLIWSEIPDYQKTEYEYLDNGDRKISTTRFDTSGQIIAITHEYQKDYHYRDYLKISYREGYYSNKNSRDSSRFSPLEEGHYQLGAKVGRWKYFNKKGQVIKEEQYKMPDREHDRFTLFEEDGTVKLSGQYESNKRVGTWKYFWKGRLEMEQHYNSGGDLTAETRYYQNGGKTTTQYRQQKKHGHETTYSTNQTILKLATYKNGIQDGPFISFDEDGHIEDQFEYKKGRRYNIKTKSNKVVYFNDYLQGYQIQRNAKTGFKIEEGNYWYGYRTGVWIYYQKDGAYTIANYPTDTLQLMNHCGENMALSYQFYDQQGTLIPAYKN